MRRLRRPELNPTQAKYLEKKQGEVNAGAAVSATWKKARKTQTMKAVGSVLRSMTGVRSRCFFCGDSFGGDIEHFWPKEKYPKRSFRWSNLLSACGPCNQSKGDDLVFEAGRPLLIDPTREDPWDHFFYEEVTGHVVARVVGTPPVPSKKGAHTLERLTPLTLEAILEGRRRCHRNLERGVRTYLASSSPGSAEREELRRSLRDNDGYGLLEWFFLREGRDLPPFRTLRDEDASLWRNIVDAVRKGVKGLEAGALG